MTERYLQQGTRLRTIDASVDGQLFRMWLLLGQHEVEAAFAAQLGAFLTRLLGPAFARQETARLGEVELVARQIGHAGVVFPETGFPLQIIESVGQTHVGVSRQIEGVKIETAQRQDGGQKTKLFIRHITLYA